MTKAAIITLAGSSSRFSKSVGYDCHKSIYHDKNDDWTILSHHLNLLSQSSFDDIIIIGGYKYEEIEKYINDNFSNLPIHLYNNIHYFDYGSCYSLVLGIEQLNENTDNVVFIEGDLIFDTEQFNKILFAYLRIELKSETKSTKPPIPQSSPGEVL